ncbi:tRNA-splicing endonuclease subunit [Tieghemiomyces parasiticus]|uniref:tRNA-intron lyase n=1 Tax=Tieghemiomyces parasiticus TaxID=78921 RepID=A0A9W8DZ96_9FUNG|nr:tRNA-splicing endonuclease subunit [Tieghemiomyces parasiticus]
MTDSEQSTLGPDELIPTPCQITVCQGMGLVWTVQEMQALRTRHRIVGTLMGSVPDQAMQNTTHALPLSLCAEEVTLLLEIGAATLTPESGTTPWIYPQTVTEKRRYTLFKDLWYRGYYLTSGLKFGGEFLVYLDDPDWSHSRFITSILASPIQGIPSAQLVALSRLGTGVTKSRLFCAFDEARETYRYHTVNWTPLD